MNFKNILRELRSDSSKTTKEVANDLKMPRSTYSNYEQGVSQPDFETLVRIAKYFDTSTDYLLGLSDDVTPYKQWTDDNQAFANTVKKNLNATQNRELQNLVSDAVVQAINAYANSQSNDKPIINIVNKNNTINNLD